MARTRTYVAGDWTGDSDAIESMRKDINLSVIKSLFDNWKIL